MAEAPHFPDEGRPFREGPRDDTALARLAERQHGVVTVAQLRALGLGARGASHRVASGRLHRIHRSVYAVGRRGLTKRGRWMAAVLAYGPRAVLSHRDAGALRGLRADNRSTIDVSVPRPSARPRPGIAVHAAATLRADDVAVYDGIPCTSVARTLVDLGDVVGPRDVERAMEQAEVLRVFDRAAVEGALARAGPRRGAGVLRELLQEWAAPGLTESELEERFLHLCRAAALPQPAVNAWIAVHEGMVRADFLWRGPKVVVETDGRATHATREAFESDRRRDQRLMLAGFRVVRFTWRQVTRDQATVAETIGALL